MARVCVHPMCGSFEACITGAVIKVGAENVSEGKEEKKKQCTKAECVWVQMRIILSSAICKQADRFVSRMMRQSK